MNNEEFQDVLSRIKTQIRIIEYAPYLGLHPRKKSTRYYTLEEHDSVIIDNDKNCFWRNSDPDKAARGSIIDFIMYFSGRDFNDIINQLEKEINYDLDKYKNQRPAEKNNIHKLILPPKGSTRKNVYAYLIKTRKISPNIVNEFFSKKFLYQDENNNCVFVSYRNNEPCFGCRRGTYTPKRFVGDIPGSDYNWCFFVDWNSKYLTIVESVIDAMSIMTFSENTYKSSDYLALASTEKYHAVEYHIIHKKYRYTNIIIALDNDNSGVKATKIINDTISSLYNNAGKNICIDIATPINKDWNEDLTERRK